MLSETTAVDDFIYETNIDNQSLNQSSMLSEATAVDDSRLETNTQEIIDKN